MTDALAAVEAAARQSCWCRLIREVARVGGVGRRAFRVAWRCPRSVLASWTASSAAPTCCRLRCRRSRVDASEVGKCCVEHGSGLRVARGLCALRIGCVKPAAERFARDARYCSELNWFALHGSVSRQRSCRVTRQRPLRLRPAAPLPSSSRAIRYDFRLPSRRRALSTVASRRRSRSRRG